MSQRPTPAVPTEEQRPALLLAVYSWDMFLAILAIFGALAPFSGQVALGPRNEELPLGLQVLAALSSAAYAGILIIVASLLTRRLRWIPLLQIVTLAIAIVFAASSVLVAWLRGGVELVPVLVTALFVLLDLLAIAFITERRVRRWYTTSAAPPRYALGTLAFWAVSGAALIVLDAVR